MTPPASLVSLPWTIETLTPLLSSVLFSSLSHKALLCNLLYHMVLIYLTHACTIMIDYICMYIILHI